MYFMSRLLPNPRLATGSSVFPTLQSSENLASAPFGKQEFWIALKPSRSGYAAIFRLLQLHYTFTIRAHDRVNSPAMQRSNNHRTSRTSRSASNASFIVEKKLGEPSQRSIVSDSNIRSELRQELSSIPLEKTETYYVHKSKQIKTGSYRRRKSSSTCFESLSNTNLPSIVEEESRLNGDF
jgi:hypothetical protein